MTNTNTDMLELIRVADLASRQTDRWLFIASLILLLVFGYFVVRSLIKDKTDTVTELRVMREFSRTRDEQIIQQLAALNMEMKVSLDRNTEALRVNNEALKGNSIMLEKYSKSHPI